MTTRRTVRSSVALAFLVLTGVGAASTASAQDRGIPVEIRVIDEAGSPVQTAVVRNPQEAERHPVNTMTGAYPMDTLYLPDGSEMVFTKGMDLEFEVSAPGFITSNLHHIVRKRRNVIEVTLARMVLDFGDDDPEPVIQFDRDEPIDGATAEPAQ